MKKVWMVTVSEHSPTGSSVADMFIGLFATSELAKKEVERICPGVQWKTYDDDLISGTKISNSTRASITFIYYVQRKEVKSE